MMFCAPQYLYSERVNSSNKQPSLRGISVNRTTTISTSLMSRLMLNIRDPAMREPHLSEPPSAATTWVFATVALDTFATETGSSSLATYSEAPSHTGGCETDPSVPRGLENNGQS
ncbi:hypothetical protein BD310DRAFT_563154 [Dichomitus squalens]|uniref:Uncharacterized protein n=1 Tax=Dichomitus squalens TaxID=114155 RepID=A0A4Q9PS21_9APHY|nr:hypothetical protein BD310DRAFT_563154 [Dichomitus squalens]